MMSVRENLQEHEDQYASSADVGINNVGMDDVGIADIGVGEDPRYSDAFIYVKTEIDKLADTDYSEISRVCEKIIDSQSKDLRVAGYLILAKTYTDGIDGLIDASETYLSLLVDYGILLHPQRESARLQTIAWLNNEKVLQFFEKYLSSNSVKKEKLTHLRDTIENINQLSERCFGNEVERWTNLNEILQNKIDIQEKNVTAELSNLSEKSKESKEITTEHGFQKSTSEIITYLQETNDWLKAISISRASRWTALVLPQADDTGCTKLAAPRNVVLQQVRGDLLENELNLYLKNFEQYFLEPGNQYWLDLQYKIVEVARKMKLDDVADLIVDLTGRLILLQPKLQKMSFADGTPFADIKTRLWLDRIANTQTSLAKNTDEEVNSDSLMSKLDIIKNDSISNGIDSSLKKIADIHFQSECERFYLDMARIDICLNCDRQDIALHLSELLNKKIEKYKLAEWDPSLAVQVWSRLRDLLVQLKPDSQTLMRIEALNEKICGVDISSVLTFK